MPGRAKTTIARQLGHLRRRRCQARQFRRGIGAEQQSELSVGLPGAAGLQGIHRIGGPRPVQLAPLDREAGRLGEASSSMAARCSGGAGAGPA